MRQADLIPDDSHAVSGRPAVSKRAVQAPARQLVPLRPDEVDRAVGDRGRVVADLREQIVEGPGVAGREILPGRSHQPARSPPGAGPPGHRHELSAVARPAAVSRLLETRPLR